MILSSDTRGLKQHPWKLLLDLGCCECELRPHRLLLWGRNGWANFSKQN